MAERATVSATFGRPSWSDPADRTTDQPAHHRSSTRRRLHLRPDERARRGQDKLASRALGRETRPRGSAGRPWSRSRHRFSVDVACFRQTICQCGHCSMAGSRSRGRPGTASSLPEAWPAAGWLTLAVRSSALPRQTPGPPSATQSRTAIYRVMNTSCSSRRSSAGRARCRGETQRRSSVKQRGDRSSPRFLARAPPAVAGGGRLADGLQDLPSRQRTSSPEHPDLSRRPSLAVGGRLRRSCARANREAAGRLAKRGARARPGMRSSARARRRKAGRQRHHQQQPWKVTPTRGHRRSSRRQHHLEGRALAVLGACSSGTTAPEARALPARTLDTPALGARPLTGYTRTELAPTARASTGASDGLSR